jgi:sulfatase maturation enzyme AslB (radical SAM superfamily)
MDKNLYCSIIHSGLELCLKGDTPTAQHCCIRSFQFPVDITQNYWIDPRFQSLRDLNKQNKWSPGCFNCENLEAVGGESFRTGMNSKFGIGEYNSAGPKRIDLMFDISCNLACRTCGTHSSTMWQKHLKAHNLYDKKIFAPRNYTEVITALKQLDLSELGMVVFCGGETLLGQTHWEVAEWLADNVPNAKQQLTLCFQTNGTQPILEKNYDLIDRFHLVKLHVSLDGVGNKFNYLRWPADWNQVVDNIMYIRDTAPSNTMFLIEETISIFNLYYQNELDTWVKNNFTTNREGDVVHHTRHLAKDIFGLHNCSQQYVDHIRTTTNADLIPADWKENLLGVQEMLKEIHKFDQLRGESFVKTFPEVAELY